MQTLTHSCSIAFEARAPMPTTFYSVRVRVGSGGYAPLSDENTPMRPLAYVWLRNLSTKYHDQGYAVTLNENGWFIATKPRHRTISAVIWEVTE